MSSSFTKRVNELEDDQDLSSLEEMFQDHKEDHEKRTYIASAIGHLMNKTIAQVERLLSD